MLRKTFRSFLLLLVAGSCIGILDGCKTTKLKGCGCGADLNRVYKPSRMRYK